MATFVLDGRTMQDHYWGIGRYVFHLAVAMAHAAPADTFRVLYNPTAKNTRFDLTQLGKLPNVLLLPAPAHAFSVGEQGMAFNPAILQDAQMFHAPYYALPYAMSLPLVVTLEDVTPLVVPTEMPNPLKREVYRTLVQIAATRAARIITISAAARSDLVRQLPLSPEKIDVIPLAVFDTFAPALPEEIARVRESQSLPPRYFLYLGINKPHKNLMRLVEAFSSARTDAALVIAGHWDGRFPEVKEFVDAHSLGYKVLFRHNVADADLPALLSGALAFVFPSIHEGFGLPPLEAMACGTPVVCSNASALPEVVGDAGLYFDPHDVSAIANTLTQVAGDPKLCAALRRRGLQRAQTFSWERTASETLRIYRDVIS